MKKKSAKKTDKLFKEKKKIDFVFDKSVVDVFDNMLKRSVPFYNEIQRMIIELAQNFAKSNSTIYDLGCSQGTTCFNLSKNISHKSIKIVGIDNSEDMIKEEKKRQNSIKNKKISFKQANISENLILKNASIAILSLTLQFVRPADRLSIIKNIYRQLLPGGALILIEKNILDGKLNRLFIDLYYSLKKRNNYTETEIAQKRLALENVLIPYTIEENRNLLKEAGFKNIETFFQWYNFSGIIAVK